MFKKSWKEMKSIDVLPYCECRDEKGEKIYYLNWAKCVELLHENGADVVYFEPLINERTGSTLFMTDQVYKDKYDVTNRCYEVRVKIVIDDIEYVQNYPLMNGVNPVKDNSINQLRISNAHARAFVKGVAIRTGLGFGLWLKEDETVRQEPSFDDYLDQSIDKYYKKIAEMVTQKVQGGVDIAEALGYDDFDSVRADITSCCNRLKSIESKVRSL